MLWFSTSVNKVYGQSLGYLITRTTSINLQHNTQELPLDKPDGQVMLIGPLNPFINQQQLELFETLTSVFCLAYIICNL